MSNLPQYVDDWGNKDNKEKAPMCYMAALIRFILKREMSGAAPNIGNVADSFKVSCSQFSRLTTANNFRSGPSGYIPKRRKIIVKGDPSASEVKKGKENQQEKDDPEGYLLQNE